MQNRVPDLESAVAAYRNVIALFEKISPHCPQAILARMNLCICVAREGKFAEAARELEEVDAERRLTLGENNLYAVSSAALHSILDFARGDYARVVQEAPVALEFYVAHEPASNRNVVQLRGLYGLALTRTGHAKEGEPYLRAAYRDGQKTERFAFTNTFGNVESALGECLDAQARYAEAEPLLLAGYADLKTRLGESHPLSQAAAARLATMYSAWQKPAEAARFASRPTITVRPGQ
ncbi:MAG: hypothetical protein ACR2NX_01335 [Chthoniobacterales bacterium]